MVVDKRKEIVLAFFISVVLALILFGNSLKGDFVFDDKFVIVGNPLIDSGPPSVKDIFSSPYHYLQPRTGLYRPLAIFSYALNFFLFGNSPVSFHLVNILLHALSAFLLFLLVRKLANKGAAWLSLILFSVLPIHSEAVASIIGRAEILSLIFVLGALLVSLRRRLFLGAVLFLFGLFSKENAIAFLPILFFADFFVFKRGTRETVKNMLWPAGALLIYAIFRWLALGKYFLANDATQIFNPVKFAAFWPGLWTSFKVFYLYLHKTFFAFSFSSDYSFNQIPLIVNPLHSLETMLGVGLLILFIFIAVRARNSILGFGAAFFLFFYFVVSNWIFKVGTIMAERLIYAPSVGLAVMISYAADRATLKFNRKILLLPMILLVSYYGYKTIDRNHVWLNEKNLFQSAYKTAPNSVVNMTNMAYLDLMAGNYNSGRDRIDKVLSLAPEHVPALNLAGQIYKKLGKLKEAEDFWKKAIDLRKDYLRGYLSLGTLYYENGYFRSAEYILNKAMEIYPRWSEVFILSLTKTAMGKYDEAIEIIRAKAGANPPQLQLNFALAAAYYKKGERKIADDYLRKIKNTSEGVEELRKAIEKNNVFLIGDLW